MAIGLPHAWKADFADCCMLSRVTCTCVAVAHSRHLLYSPYSASVASGDGAV